MNPQSPTPLAENAPVRLDMTTAFNAGTQLGPPEQQERGWNVTTVYKASEGLQYRHRSQGFSPIGIPLHGWNGRPQLLYQAANEIEEVAGLAEERGVL